MPSPLALSDHTADAGMLTLSPKPKRMAMRHGMNMSMRTLTHVGVTSHNTHPHPQHSWAVRRHAAGPQAQPPPTTPNARSCMLHEVLQHGHGHGHTHATDPAPHLQSCQKAALASSKMRHIAAVTTTSSCCASGSSAESPESTPYCMSSSSVAQKRVPFGKKNS